MVAIVIFWTTSIKEGSFVSGQIVIFSRHCSHWSLSIIGYIIRRCDSFICFLSKVLKALVMCMAVCALGSFFSTLLFEHWRHLLGVVLKINFREGSRELVFVFGWGIFLSYTCRHSGTATINIHNSIPLLATIRLSLLHWKTVHMLLHHGLSLAVCRTHALPTLMLVKLAPQHWAALSLLLPWPWLLQCFGLSHVALGEWRFIRAFKGDQRLLDFAGHVIWCNVWRHQAQLVVDSTSSCNRRIAALSSLLLICGHKTVALISLERSRRANPRNQLSN